MQLPAARAEIEHRRRQIHPQRREIRDRQRAGIPTVSAEELLARMLGRVLINPRGAVRAQCRLQARSSWNDHKQLLVNSRPSQGVRSMRIMTVALGTALVLCNLGTFSAAAHARKAKVVREPPERLVVVPTTIPYWDYNIVPRYRYRPEDDRVDPYGPPVAPVIRYGNQEEYIPAWY